MSDARSSVLSRLKMRIGSKLACTVGMGVLLVAAMIANQHQNNKAISSQAAMERDEQTATADLLRASIALQRMQIGIREIRLTIAEREANEVLANLKQNANIADTLLNGALLQCSLPADCDRLLKLSSLAGHYAQTAAEVTRLKNDYQDSKPQLDEIAKFGKEIDALLEMAISAAQARASDRTAAGTQRMSESARLNIGFGVFAISILIAAAIFCVLSIGRPIGRMTTILLRLAHGERSLDIPYIARGDEVGDLARAAHTFQSNLMRLEDLEAAQKKAAEHQAKGRKEMVGDLAKKFEQAVGDIASTVSSAALELELAAGTLARNASATQNLSAEATVASNESSTNVQSVANATAEFSTSTEEIIRQARHSTEIATAAVSQAKETDARISRLSKSADHIGEMISIISGIARQTNLLALNATIEAARAGDAGRGFSVVASEVKTLATETAKATELIRAQIEDIQNTTRESVAAISLISGTIGQISHISASITAAVSAQSDATQEISQNIGEAAQRAAGVAQNIQAVNREASETGDEAAKVLRAAQTLSAESRELKRQLDDFVRTVQAA